MFCFIFLLDKYFKIYALCLSAIIQGERFTEEMVILLNIQKI